jgi:protease I
MKALVLTADQFEDMEVMYPLFRLREAGWQVDVAAPKKEPIHGEFGYAELMPDVTIDKANAAEYDLLLITGGSPTGAPATVRKLQKAQEITQYFFAKGKTVAAVCHGPWTLADSGVIKGRHLTSYWHDGVPETVKKAGGIWEDKEVVVDSNLVTSRWPDDLPAFMREVMNLTNHKT